MECKELNYEKISIAVNGFIACCYALNSNYSIKGGFTVYGQNIQHATVLVLNKSFTARGDDAIEKTLRDAAKWMIKTFSQFEEFKKILEQKEIENKYCSPAIDVEIRKIKSKTNPQTNE